MDDGAWIPTAKDDDKRDRATEDDNERDYMVNDDERD